MTAFLADDLAGLEPYVPGEQPEGLEAYCKLNANENPYPPSPAVVAALQAFNFESLRLYPDAAGTPFKAALSEVFGLSPAHFSIANGSDEILALVFAGFCGRGAAFADVTYSFYPCLAALTRRPCRIVPLRADFTWQPADYAACTETVIVANPNAPTSLAAPLENLEALCVQNPARLVVVDEAYVDFGGESALALVPAYENLLVVRTLSKSRSLAGMRVAFAVAQPQLIEQLEGLRASLNPYNVDAVAQAAAAASLRDVPYFETTRQAICAARDEAAEGLRALGFSVLPSSTNFLLAEPPAGLSPQAYQRQLRERGFLIRYFNAPRVRNYVRISVGTRADMQRLVQETAAICENAENVLANEEEQA